jgi:hypothetical protein
MRHISRIRRSSSDSDGLEARLNRPTMPIDIRSSSGQLEHFDECEKE